MDFLFLIIGILVGIFLTAIVSRKEPIGTLRVNNSEDDTQPYLFLEIDKGKAHLIECRKRITLRVDMSQN